MWCGGVVVDEGAVWSLGVAWEWLGSGLGVAWEWWVLMMAVRVEESEGGVFRESRGCQVWHVWRFAGGLGVWGGWRHGGGEKGAVRGVVRVVAFCVC